VSTVQNSTHRQSQKRPCDCHMAVLTMPTRGITRTQLPPWRKATTVGYASNPANGRVTPLDGICKIDGDIKFQNTRLVTHGVKLSITIQRHIRSYPAVYRSSLRLQLPADVIRLTTTCLAHTVRINPLGAHAKQIPSANRVLYHEWRWSSVEQLEVHTTIHSACLVGEFGSYAFAALPGRTCNS